MKIRRRNKIIASISIVVVLLSLHIYKNAYAVTPRASKHNARKTVARQEPLKGKTIVLDPGHGGDDDGTTSLIGTPEKTLTLATVKVVEEKLENAGAHVIMTRNDDTYISLEQRAAILNQNQADAFISFHYNWLDGSIRYRANGFLLPRIKGLHFSCGYH